jgi:acyl-CoA synthetase (AMP-forming)/AMP-acid ligase II
MQDPRHSATLVELLRQRLAERPQHLLYTYLVDGDEREERLTYAELDRRARAIAAHLQGRVEPGDRVLLIFQSDLQFVTSFFGCLYAGAVAVPGYPPRFHQNLPDQKLERLTAMLGDCRPAVMLTTGAIHARMEVQLPALPQLHGLPVIVTDELEHAEPGPWKRPALDAGTLALLQYTSGSTGRPKGVQISHGNLLHNERQIESAFGLGSWSTQIGWLPLHHDMGLIGMLLQPLYNGSTCVFLSPGHFLQRPLRWMRAVSRYRGTITQGPDFGYRLLARPWKPEELAGLDLSSLTATLNGAEPVRADTLRDFAAVFAPYGFDARSFFPCYGMAEATLLVSGAHGRRTPALKHVSAPALLVDRVVAARVGASDARALVGCGLPCPDVDVAIVDPATLRRVDTGRVGEIWIQGANVSSGYWDKDELNAEQFRAHTASGEGPYYRTGDLGFLEDGMLFINGRLKDLIIIEGRNHYPQDIERTVEEAYETFHAGGAAAFSMEYDGIERLVVVQELERRVREIDAAEAGLAVRRAVATAHEIVPREVVFLKAGGLPKTSSGKVQRRACKLALRKGELQILGRASWPE